MLYYAYMVFHYVHMDMIHLPKGLILYYACMVLHYAYMDMPLYGLSLLGSICIMVTWIYLYMVCFLGYNVALY